MKRNLILTFLACGASLTLGPALHAQTASPSPSASPSASASPAGHHGHKGGHHEMLEHLTKALNLSDDQKTKVAAVLEQEKPQFKALREEEKAKRKTLIENASSQITPILNAEQQQKFAAMVQHVENGGGKHFGHGPGGGKGEGKGAFLEKMVTDLGLTADQQNQIKPILAAAKTQAEAIRSNTALTPEDKKAQLKDVWEGVQGQVTGLLTAPQQQKLAELKASHPHHHRHGGGAVASPSPSPAA